MISRDHKQSSSSYKADTIHGRDKQLFWFFAHVTSTMHELVASPHVFLISLSLSFLSVSCCIYDLSIQEKGGGACVNQ